MSCRVSLVVLCFVPLVSTFRAVKEEDEGEFRPLVLKTDRESVLRGEDYWIDYKEVRIIPRS